MVVQKPRTQTEAAQGTAAFLRQPAGPEGLGQGLLGRSCFLRDIRSSQIGHRQRYTAT